MELKELQKIITEVNLEAHISADKFFKETMNGHDVGSCGFAWVNIYSYQGKKIKGNTRLGKMLKTLGIRQDYRGIFQIWDPSSYPVQNIDTLEAGAHRAQEVLRSYGFKAYACSRLD